MTFSLILNNLGSSRGGGGYGTVSPNATRGTEGVNQKIKIGYTFQGMSLNQCVKSI